MDEEVPSLIFDLGTNEFKLGVSGMDKPKYSLTPALTLTADAEFLYTKDDIDKYINSTDMESKLKIIKFILKFINILR